MSLMSGVLDINTDKKVLDVLARLNQIGLSINQLGSKESANLEDILRLIVESATEVVPGSAAILYGYDDSGHTTSRASAGEWIQPVLVEEPRKNGLGMAAIREKRRILSYEEPEIEIHPAKIEAGARSAVCCPMFDAGIPVGILYVYLNQARKFRPYELLLLDNFVNQAVMAIAQMRRLDQVRRDLARKEDELSKLRHAGLVISSRLKLEETLDVILQMALELTNAKYGIFRLVDKTNQNLVMRALAGEYYSQPLVEALPIKSKSVMAWVARNRKTVCIGDLGDAQWSEMYYPLDAEMQMRSELAVPLIGASGRLEGVLNLESPKLNAFSEQDSHMLQSLATQAVIAIQEARLLDALQEITELLLTKSDRTVLIRLVNLACELLNANSSAVWVLEGDRLILQASSDGEEHSQSVPLYHSFAGRAVLTAGAVITQNAKQDTEFHRQDLAETYQWERVLAAPLLSGERQEPIGAISIYGSSVEHISNSDWDAKVLNSLAHYASLAVQNTANEQELRIAHEKRVVAEAFAAIGDISANLLHHLNNKVGTIPVRIQGIQDKCQSLIKDEPYLAKNLREIEHSARQAMVAMRESLTHLNPIYLAPVNIEDCVRDAISDSHLPAEIQVQLISLDQLPPVYAGREGLVLVFYNLLQNAAEAIDGNGIITINGLVRSRWVEVVVSDNGPGIDPALHERIFEFNYSNRGGSSEGKLGFGLWWVKTWMTRMEGAVLVESDGYHGATFRLRLPFTKDKG